MSPTPLPSLTEFPDPTLKVCRDELCMLTSPIDFQFLNTQLTFSCRPLIPELTLELSKLLFSFLHITT